MPAVLWLSIAAFARTPWPVDYDIEGIELGRGIIFNSRAETTGGYDDRAFYSGDEASGDFYADAAVAATLENIPSVYNWQLNGRYGLRFSAEDHGYQDDFYSAGGSLRTEKRPLVWGVSGNVTKSLDYNTAYDPDTGQGPDSILTYRVNTRYTAAADLAYERPISKKTAIVPGYGFSYNDYLYADGGSGDASMIHLASLMAVYRYSSKVELQAGLRYSFQWREEENGRIGTALVGLSHQMTPKTSWGLSLGYALADYEVSGEDQGFVSNLKGSWQVTQKVSAYVFGGNDFQPGYSGGAARWVYRLGYGAAWQVVKKMALSGSVLHDYQQAVGDSGASNDSYGHVRHYINLSADYRPVDELSLIAGYNHNRDERPDPQNKIYLQAVYRFY